MTQNERQQNTQGVKSTKSANSLFTFKNTTSQNVMVWCVGESTSQSGDQSSTYYSNPLTLLQTQSGETTIPSNQSEGVSIVIPASLNELMITILVTQTADTFFYPVATASVTTNSKLIAMNVPGLSNSVTISQADIDSITACANLYIDTLGSPKAPSIAPFLSALSSSDVVTNVNNFFAKSSSYKGGSLTSYNAVSSYYMAYPFVWTDSNNSVTYYLCSADTSDSSLSDAATGFDSNGQVTISIANATLNQDNSGCTATYTDTNGNVTSLTWQAGQSGVPGQFSDSKGEITMQGGFLDVSQFTQLSSSAQYDQVTTPLATYAYALAGTIPSTGSSSGLSVSGITVSQSSMFADGVGAVLKGLWKELLSDLMTYGGALLTLIGLYHLGKKTPPAKEAADAENKAKQKQVEEEGKKVKQAEDDVNTGDRTKPTDDSGKVDADVNSERAAIEKEIESGLTGDNVQGAVKNAMDGNVTAASKEINSIEANGAGAKTSATGNDGKGVSTFDKATGDGERAGDGIGTKVEPIEKPVVEDPVVDY